MGYLVDKYGKDDKLYPKNLRQRAIVDQRLHFEGGVLFPTHMAMVVRFFFWEIIIRKLLKWENFRVQFYMEEQPASQKIKSRM